jgi:membrane protein required for colicin V production
MNTLDLVILVVVLIGLARGFATGGIRQILSLAGVVLALLVSARLTSSIGERVAEMLGVSDSLAPIASFVVTFFVIQAAVFGLSRLLEKFLKALQLGILNRVLGGALGGFKAVLVVSLVLFVARFVGMPGQEAQQGSMLYGLVYPILPASWEFVAGRVPAVRSRGNLPENVFPDSPEE